MLAQYHQFRLHSHSAHLIRLIFLAVLHQVELLGFTLYLESTSTVVKDSAMSVHEIHTNEKRILK